MPNWKFWEKPSSATPNSDVGTDTGLRFGVRPRADLPGAGRALDPAKREQLLGLRKRRETILFDVEQAELATDPDNPWAERIRIQDEALDAVSTELESAKTQTESVSEPFESLPIEDLNASEGPPPSVTFNIGDQRFTYQEDQDWAERGFQLARGDLQLVDGNPAMIIAKERSRPDFDARLGVLTSALFVFASDLRDRVLAGQKLPDHVTLTELSKPDPVNGGWTDWKGHSPALARKEARLHELHEEQRRLLDSRSREVDDLAKWEDRLPIARRRLADVDAEIAALGG